MSDLITPHIIHDHALGKNDQPSFLFEEYAKTFARLIAESKTATPIVVGVSGKWGSGKTTLLKMIKDHLDSTQHLHENISKLSFVNPTEEVKQFRRCRTVWFNAWKYADEDELLVALVRVIVQEMYRDDFIEKAGAALYDPFPARRDVINTVLSWFAIKSPIVEAKLNTGTPVETTFAKKAALLDQFSEVFDRLSAVWVHSDLAAKKIDSRQGVLTIFIDDLDRCLPEKAIQVLEAIKLFLDREGVAFVLAADEDAIRAAIEAHHERSKIKDQRADDYLEKIFQVRFSLPALTSTQVGNYVASNLHVEDEILRQQTELISLAAESNPRQVKTLLNYLSLNWAILQNSGRATGVNPPDFVQWLLLYRTNKAFCERVGDLDRNIRLEFIAGASVWASDPSNYKKDARDYEKLIDLNNRRIRDILIRLKFSDRVTPEMLDGFIRWDVLFEIEEKRRTEALLKRKQEEEKRKQDKVARREKEEQERQAADAKEKTYFSAYYWIEIPAGKFVMGSDKGGDDEHPQHTIEILYAFRIARYPVTNADFAKFVNATKYKTTAEEAGRAWVKGTEVKGANWAHPSGPKSTIDQIQDHPVVQVSWRDAIAYCEWLGQNLQGLGDLGLNVRLPTEAEWEKSARGEYGKEYPWGDEFDKMKCNTAESGIGGTTPVGKFSPQGDSPYGVADMAGNVWEWCQSKNKAYPYKAKDGREELKGDDARVLRGGSFNYSQRYSRGACRNFDPPLNRFNSIGFRVVVSSLS
ncbi:MAG: SUMF1/EgtB/PvdO family nonheme iron enzyme [Chloroflexi bacterium]|nr:SUMF1/EgtB/PvdO family nonheme iron enzyme [Chloroflexota bacterium]